MALAIQGPTCTDKNKVNLKQFLDSSEETQVENKETKADSSSSSSQELTDEVLKAMEEELTNVVTPEQRKHAMRILGGFRKGATEIEKDAAMVSQKKYYYS